MRRDDIKEFFRIMRLRLIRLLPAEKQMCPRRGELGGMPLAKGVEGPDRWERRMFRSKMRYCSWCGGLHPEDALEAIGKGKRDERTTKRYKFYLSGKEFQNGQAKVYVQHFSKQQLEELNSLIRADGDAARVWSER